MFSSDEPLDFGSSSGSSGSDLDLFDTEEPSLETDLGTEEPAEDTLPSPADLNIGDVSDSTNPELA
jgi:hypothetical protein